MRVCIDLNPVAWARVNLRGRRYVTAREVAEMLGVDVRVAGKLLRELERLGLVERHSRRVYKVLLGGEGQEGYERGPLLASFNSSFKSDKQVERYTSKKRQEEVDD